MIFIDYNDAEPILTEYSPDEALRILLEKHQEFDAEAIEVVVSNAQQELIGVTDPEIIFASYVTTVVQIRAFKAYADLSVYS